MERIDPRRGYPCGIRGVDAAAGHDLDTAARNVERTPQVVESLQGRGASARGKYARAAAASDIVDRTQIVARDIYRTVERSLHRRSRLDKTRRALDVDIAVGRQKTEHDAVGTRLPRELYLAEHLLVLTVGIEKIAAARTYHHTERVSSRLACHGNGRSRGCGAALGGRRAEFDAVDARARRYAASLDGICTEFVCHKKRFSF